MEEFFRDALTLKSAPTTFNLDCAEERAALAAALWSKQPVLGEDSLTTKNGALTSLLQVVMRNTYSVRSNATEQTDQRRAFRLEGVLSNI